MPATEFDKRPPTERKLSLPPVPRASEANAVQTATREFEFDVRSPELKTPGVEPTRALFTAAFLAKLDPSMGPLLQDQSVRIKVIGVTQAELLKLLPEQYKKQLSSEELLRVRGYSERAPEVAGGPRQEHVYLSDRLFPDFSKNPPLSAVAELLTTFHHELSHLSLARTGRDRLLSLNQKEVEVIDNSVAGLRTIYELNRRSGSAAEREFAGALKVRIDAEDSRSAELKKK